MSNGISREKIFEIFSSQFPKLLPLVALPCADLGIVFFKMADGSRCNQFMEEVTNQGCPFSAILAALVLNEVLHHLDERFKMQAAVQYTTQGRIMDDNAGGERTRKATSVTVEQQCNMKMFISFCQSSIVLHLKLPFAEATSSKSIL